ncbi:T9SS type A sorting domain-containing protein [uncultured Aquimarina sp.]|uniref:T9SS type A sorting domain-containing protein n=1 Tax=uncultured Aquimarina sp. TaxID=575652 RepID=UPI00260948A9|nr:T9SS type A sorting domain-containing protein [uncultured Aquimarina sp.]
MKKIYLLLIFIGVFSLSFSTGVQAQSSFNTTDQKEEIQIFPNPVSGDILNVTSKSGKSITCRVFNVLGKTVLYKVITTEKLNISALSPGVYVLRMKIGNITQVQKLVRQ